ncbi:mechanosensitive ion channel domain-containing protein [Devosia sp. 2618]|uniref:mechanosensitive ion channel domain-containing protein n=1 Tax=Devosia sp. 2618 TaxID=3156454 RepID=UPI00339A317A
MKFFASWAVLAVTLLLGAQAMAQDAPVVDTRTEALQRLIVVLENDELRTEILDQLRQMTPDAAAGVVSESPSDLARAAPREEGSPELGVVEAISDWSSGWVEQLPRTTFGIPIDQKASQAASQVSSRIEAGVKNGELAQFALWAIPSLIVAVVGGLAIRRLGRGLTVASKPVRKGRLVLGLVLKTTAYFAFLLFIGLGVQFFNPTDVGSRVFMTLAVGVLASMFSADIAISALSSLAGWRGVRLVNYCQKRFYRWWLAILLLSTYAALCNDHVVRRVIGWSAADMISFVVNIIAASVTFFFVVRHRAALGNLIFGKTITGHRSENAFASATRRLSRYWHWLVYAILILSVMSLIAGQRNSDAFTQMLWSLGSILVAFVVGVLVQRALSGWLERPRRLRGAVRQAVLAGVVRMLRIGANATIALLTTVIIARIWGFDLWGWLSRDGQQLVRPILAAGVCAVIAWLIWIALDAWIASALTPTDAFGRPRQRSNRVQTLLPLVRNGMMILLVLLAGIAVLANIGVNVTPLIAGAGVFGLALSFGSQQLVQDVITGVFILAEDTIAIGDTINTGDRSGVVEGISLRTIRLRDADGALHSIPFSTVKALKNSSRNFGIFRPRYSIPASVDPEVVMQVMRETAAELRADPKYAQSMNGDLHNVGIEEINAGSVVVSGSLRTAPVRLTQLTRAFNGKFRAGLAERGIVL